MTVQELIEELLNLNPDALVVLQKDSEGNDYSPLVGAEECSYLPQTTWSGEAFAQEDVEDYGYSRETLDKIVDAVVLWPTN